MKLPSIDRIFWDAAQAASAAERDAYLENACADDVELRRRVQQLLDARSKAIDFLEPRAASPVAEVDERTLNERSGAVIGPYKLLEQIGEGGFGIVFMAEQQYPVRRKVALKVLKPGMDTRRVIARFEAERQALALMDHPNIARVFDGGETASGGPFFVMELVKGLPITDYSDQSQLTLDERLELFIPVCQAVQHAHQKGIIHRDLKPSNVLVTLHDGTPVIKVIDFGIAKATGQKLTEKTLFTNFAQLIGTPLYMSPEQTAFSGLDVDTRSDIYSLGVVLYELLTGTTPFDRVRFHEAAYDETLRIIREEDPPAPSKRISTLGFGATALAVQRKCDPKRLSGRFRAELDWIVMKCLEKDRNRRYESASSLARDIQRFLQDQPVQACPPSAIYRFRKFARRNKVSLGAAAFVSAAVLAAVIGLAVSNARISREKNEKDRALVQASHNYEAAEANLMLARHAVDEMYTQVTRRWGGQNAMLPFERDVLQKALRFYQEFAKRKSSDPVIRLEAARARLRVGSIQLALGERALANEACNEAISLLEELVAWVPTEPERLSLLATAYHLRGSMLIDAGRIVQAERTLRQALALRGQLAAAQPDDPDLRANLAETERSLGTALFDRPQESENAFRESARLCEDLVARERGKARYGAHLIASYISIGEFLSRVGRLHEAETAFGQALDRISKWDSSLIRIGTHSLLARAEFSLGNVLAAGGQVEAAETAYRRAIASEQRLADQFPDEPGFRRNLAAYAAKLAALLQQTRRQDEAAVFNRSARELFAKLEADGTDDEELLQTLASAGRSLRESGDLGPAEDFQRRAVILASKLAMDRAEPIDRQRLAQSHAELGIILQRRGRTSEAADQFRKLSAIYGQLAMDFPDEPDYRHRMARASNYLGIALRGDASQRATALECHQQAIETCEKLVVDFPDRPAYTLELVRGHFSIGILLRLSDRLEGAVQAFERALEAYRPSSGTDFAPENQSQFAAIHNEWAWLLATTSDSRFRDPNRAVQLSRSAVSLASTNAGFWNTLGIACYYDGKLSEGRAALEKSIKLSHGGNSFDWLFLAMVQCRQGETADARKWYERANEWIEAHKPKDEELHRFYTEAAELLSIGRTSNSESSKRPP